MGDGGFNAGGGRKASVHRVSNAQASAVRKTTVGYFTSPRPDAVITPVSSAAKPRPPPLFGSLDTHGTVFSMARGGWLSTSVRERA